MPQENPLKPNLDTNRIFELTPGCKMLSNGKINCSSVIYFDRKTWLESRHKIDSEIQRLKQKLENLKEIRRHLKQSKPTKEGDDFKNEFTSTEYTPTTQFNNRLLVDLVPPSSEISHRNVYPETVTTDRTTTSKYWSSTENIYNTTDLTTPFSKKKKKYYSDDLSNMNRRRKQKKDYNVSDTDYVFNITNSPDIINATDLTTEEPKLSTNHHRHDHRTHNYYSTTKNYNRLRTTTESSLKRVDLSSYSEEKVKIKVCLLSEVCNYLIFL